MFNEDLVCVWPVYKRLSMSLQENFVTRDPALSLCFRFGDGREGGRLHPKEGVFWKQIGRQRAFRCSTAGLCTLEPDEGTIGLAAELYRLGVGSLAERAFWEALLFRPSAFADLLREKEFSLSLAYTRPGNRCCFFFFTYFACCCKRRRGLVFFFFFFFTARVSISPAFYVMLRP